MESRGTTSYDRFKQNAFINQNINKFPSYSTNKDTVIQTYKEGKLSKRIAFAKVQNELGSNRGDISDDSARILGIQGGTEESKQGAGQKAVKAKDDVFQGVNDFLFPYTPAVGDRVLNPGREFDLYYDKRAAKEKANTKTFFDVPILGEASLGATRFVTSKGAETYATWGAGGAILGGIPRVGIVLGNPIVKKTATTALVGSTIISADTSTNLATDMGSLGGEIGIGGTGFTSGFKSTFGSFKSPKVQRVEAVKSISETRASDKNLGFFNDEGFNVAASQMKGQGGGMYKVGNKFFKLTFTETGKGINLNSNQQALFGNTKIKIQEYKYAKGGFNINSKNKLTRVLTTPEQYGLNPNDPQGIRIKNTFYLGRRLRTGRAPYGHYDPLKNTIYIDRLQPKLEKTKTLIHEFGHSKFAESGYGNTFFDASLKGRKSSRFRGIAGQIYNDYRQLKPARAKEDATISGIYYPKGQGLEEFAVRFAENNPSELIKPTTETGRFLSSKIYPKGSILYTPEQSKLVRNKVFEITPKILRPVKGRPRTAIMESSGRVTKSGDNELLDVISKVSSKQGSFYRVTSGKIVNKEGSSTFIGESFDATNKKILPDSRNIIAGRSDLIMSSQESNLYGDVLTRTTSKNINLGISKGTIKSGFKADLKNIGRSYNKQQFVTSSNNLLGVQSQTKTNLNILSGNIPANQLLKTRTVVNYPKASLAFPSQKAKTIQTQRKPSIIPKLSNLTRTSTTNILSSFPLQKQNNILGTTNIPKRASRYDTSMKNRYDTMMKQSALPMQKQSQNLIQRQVQKQRQRQVQRQVMRQSPYMSRFSPYNRMMPPMTPTFSFDIPKQIPLKKSKYDRGSSFKSLYQPSVAASFFNIRGRGKYDLLSRTGLVVRPLRGL